MTTRTHAGRALTIVAMVLAGLFGLFAMLFTAGETLADPGGWQAIGLIALWLVPLIVLVALALIRPSVAQPVLVVLTAICLAVALWSLVASHAWRSFESTSGPVRAVACLVLVLAVTALGWHRQLPAGVMLLVVGIAAVLAVGSAPLRLMALPALVIGALLLAAGLVEQGHHENTSIGPPTLPSSHHV